MIFFESIPLPFPAAIPEAMAPGHPDGRALLPGILEVGGQLQLSVSSGRESQRPWQNAHLTLMSQTTIQAGELVRQIWDPHYAILQNQSRAAINAFFHREAAANAEAEPLVPQSPPPIATRAEP